MALSSAQWRDIWAALSRSDPIKELRRGFSPSREEEWPSSDYLEHWEALRTMAFCQIHKRGVPQEEGELLASLEELRIDMQRAKPSSGKHLAAKTRCILELSTAIAIIGVRAEADL